MSAEYAPIVVPMAVAENVLTVGMGIETTITTAAADVYRGAYSVTPAEEEQTLETEGYLLTGNVTVEPIPSNYGKISWNGSFLSVS